MGGGGGGGNKEQRFPNGNHTGIYVHLLMEIDLQAQIQTAFQSTLEQLLFCFPTNIHSFCVCAQYLHHLVLVLVSQARLGWVTSNLHVAFTWILGWKLGSPCWAQQKLY